jgi:hypothetical protein
MMKLQYIAVVSPIAQATLGAWHRHHWKIVRLTLELAAASLTRVVMEFNTDSIRSLTSTEAITVKHLQNDKNAMAMTY